MGPYIFNSFHTVFILLIFITTTTLSHANSTEKHQNKTFAELTPWHMNFNRKLNLADLPLPTKKDVFILERELFVSQYPERVLSHEWEPTNSKKYRIDFHWQAYRNIENQRDIFVTHWQVTYKGQTYNLIATQAQNTFALKLTPKDNRSLGKTSTERQNTAIAIAKSLLDNNHASPFPDQIHTSSDGITYSSPKTSSTAATNNTDFFQSTNNIFWWNDGHSLGYYFPQKIKRRYVPDNHDNDWFADTYNRVPLGPINTAFVEIDLYRKSRLFALAFWPQNGYLTKATNNIPEKTVNHIQSWLEKTINPDIWHSKEKYDPSTFLNVPMLRWNRDFTLGLFTSTYNNKLLLIRFQAYDGGIGLNFASERFFDRRPDQLTKEDIQNIIASLLNIPTDQNHKITSTFKTLEYDPITSTKPYSLIPHGIIECKPNNYRKELPYITPDPGSPWFNQIPYCLNPTFSQIGLSQNIFVHINTNNFKSQADNQLIYGFPKR